MNENIKSIIIQSEKYAIIDSGMVMAFDKQAGFVINYGLRDFKFAIKMTFQTDSDDREPHYEINQENSEVLHFVLYNFNSYFGSGNAEAVRVAVHENKSIFFRFWISQLGETGAHRLDYTLYKEL